MRWPIPPASPNTCARPPPRARASCSASRPNPTSRIPPLNIAFATQGGLGLPDKNYYFDADKQDKRDAYVAHVAKVLELSGVAAADAAKQAKDVMAFETRLAKVSKSNEELSRDVELYYNPVSPADADKLAPNFPWTKFFESQGVAAPKMFSFAMPAFHAEVSKMLADVPADQWKSYLRFHTVDGASPYLSEAFVQENFNFYNKTLVGQKEIKPRWKRVLATLDGKAGEAFGQLYVKVAFPAESKARMETLIKNMSEALKARIENLAWMSPETKAKALEKWEAFDPRIGYPDKWRDWTGLSTSRDSYIGNVLAANEFNYKWELGKIGQPVDKTEWGMRPQTVNASYNPQQNQLTFPAAILQPPFFDPKADDATNYGGIGAVIGHEMTHGYDDQGSRFGPTGKFENWWTDADAKGFAALTGKLAKQFDGYEAAPGMMVNGIPHAGREHRRPGRPGHRVRRDEEGHGRPARSDDRRTDPRPAVLPELGHGVASFAHPGRHEEPPRHRRACARPVPRDRRAVEPACVRDRVRVQARRCDGA